MRITWSLPVRGEHITASRGDLVRAFQLVRALRELGHEVTVVEFAAAPTAKVTVTAYRRLVRRLVPRRAALVLRDVGRVLHSKRHGRRVATVARQTRSDLIVETQVGFAGSGALASRLTGLPLVLDDTSPSREEEDMGAGLPGLAGRVLAQQAAAATRVVATSSAIVDLLAAEGLPREKLVVVPNGVDLATYSGVDREAARVRLGLGESLAVGFVGSFQPWHRVDLLVEAFSQIASSRGRLRLVLVGDGPHRERAVALAWERGLIGRVTATGAIPPERVPEVVASLDIGVLPAQNDYGHAMKLVEYAAAGVAPVAPDVRPVREVLTDGVTGLLFRANDVGGLRAALLQLVEDDGLRRRIGAAARRQVAASADWRERAAALAGSLPVP